MVNPAVEVNARFSPLVVKIRLYVCARARVRALSTDTHIFYARAKEGMRWRARVKARRTEREGEWPGRRAGRR